MQIRDRSIMPTCEAMRNAVAFLSRSDGDDAFDGSNEIQHSESPMPNTPQVEFVFCFQQIHVVFEGLCACSTRTPCSSVSCGGLPTL